MIRAKSISAVVALAILSVAAMPGGWSASAGNACQDASNFNCCGDLIIVFQNSDLQPQPDGKIHASGNLFAHFQIIPTEALPDPDVATLGFSFGVDSTEFDEAACDQPVVFTGQQIDNYRADRDPSDGFFINLQTGLVPDNQYTASVHVYDSDENELARFWARAVVDNCDGTTGSQCNSDEAQKVRNDQTGPYPIVLPGDGQKLDGVTGFSLEFAEALGNLTVYLNGLDISAELEDWEGRLWDNDLVPGYGPQGANNIIAQECSLDGTVHTCDYLGEAYQWNGRLLTDEDVIRIEASDLNGNEVIRNIHLASAEDGAVGDVNLPNLSWSVESTSDTVEAGSQATFAFTLVNTGGATGHPYVDATQQEFPMGWNETAWVPSHRPVAPGESSEQELQIKVPSDTPRGAYEVVAAMTYTKAKGSEPTTLKQTLTVNVVSEIEQPDNSTTNGDGKKNSPNVALPLVVVGIAILAWRRR